MSIISRNINELGKKFLENLKYRDIDYRVFTGTTTEEDGTVRYTSGEPTVLGGQVMINDLRLWLQSSKGDYYRRFPMGGFFDDNLKAWPLSDEGAASLQTALITAITMEFPSVTIIDLSVKPEMSRRGWLIKMIVRDSLTGAMAPLETGIEA